MLLKQFFHLFKAHIMHFYIVWIKKLCDGLDITLGQFFSCTLFDDLDQELQ